MHSNSVASLLVLSLLSISTIVLLFTTNVVGADKVHINVNDETTSTTTTTTTTTTPSSSLFGEQLQQHQQQIEIDLAELQDQEVKDAEKQASIEEQDRLSSEKLKLINDLDALEQSRIETAKQLNQQKRKYIEEHQLPNNAPSVSSSSSSSNVSSSSPPRLGSAMNTILRADVPQVGSASATSGAFYVFYVLQDNCNVTFAVTPYSGDPDVYVSRSVQQPDATHYDVMANDFGADEVVWVNAPQSPYYIGVYGWAYVNGGNSQFTILASLNCNGAPAFTYLGDGAPQTGFSNDSSTPVYYRFYLTQGASGVSFVVQPRFGDPDLYITTSQTPPPSASNYIWRGIRFGSDRIHLNASRANVCTGCDYFVAVICFGGPCRFTITAAALSDFTALAEGVPIQDRVAQGMYNYYTLPPYSGANNALTFVLTTLSGDADLYVSTTSQHPSVTDYQWKSSRYGSDAITVPPAQQCAGCTYYAAVHGWSNSTYSIVATWDEPVILDEGVPEFGIVPAAAYDYFRVEEPVSATKNVTIAVSTFSGMVSVVVGVGYFPNLTMFNYSSLRASAHSVLVPINQAVCGQVAICGLYIAVYGSTTANYSVVSHTHQGEIALVQGEPIQASTEAGAYDYYSFQVTNSGMTLTITVTCLTGDADLYVSTLTQQPNTTNYQYAATSFGGDTVIISNAATGVYYIGVHGFSHTVYTIVATASGATPQPVVLIDGVPQSNVVQRNQYLYYYFYQFQQFNFYLTLTSQSGNATAFIANNGRFPTSSNYQWTTNNHLEILNAPSAIYFVGVYGNMDSRFSLTVSTSLMFITLQEGMPYSDVIYTQDNYHYFMFSKIDSTSSLIITLTTSSGDPDLFISTTNQRPNATSYTWFSNNYGNDTITIAPSDTNACGNCNYYIGVRGYTANSAYTLVVTTGQIRLINRVAQQGSVSASVYNYYYFDVDAINSQIKFVVQNTAGSSYLYAATSANPTRSTATWKSESSTSQQVITLEQSDFAFCNLNVCRYYVGVYGVSNAVFTIVATDDQE